MRNICRLCNVSSSVFVIGLIFEPGIWKSESEKVQLPLWMIELWALLLTIFDTLRDFVPFAQCEKREKHPWKSDTKSITHPLVFFTFFKLNKWYKIAQSISIDLELSDIKGLVEKGIINWVTHQFSKVLKMCKTYSERLLKVDP